MVASDMVIKEEGLELQVGVGLGEAATDNTEERRLLSAQGEQAAADIIDEEVEREDEFSAVKRTLCTCVILPGYPPPLPQLRI